MYRLIIEPDTCMWNRVQRTELPTKVRCKYPVFYIKKKQIAYTLPSIIHTTKATLHYLQEQKDYSHLVGLQYKRIAIHKQVDQKEQQLQSQIDRVALQRKF